MSERENQNSKWAGILGGIAAIITAIAALASTFGSFGDTTSTPEQPPERPPELTLKPEPEPEPEPEPREVKYRNDSDLVGQWHNYCAPERCHFLIYGTQAVSIPFEIDLNNRKIQSAIFRINGAVNEANYAHGESPPYCANISINGRQVESQLSLASTPPGNNYGGPFTNFGTLSYRLSNSSRNLLVNGTNYVQITLGCAGPYIPEDYNNWLVSKWTELSLTILEQKSGRF